MRISPMLALAALLVASPALACTGPSVQISGDFQTGEKAWGESDAQFQAKGPEAIFMPQVGTQSARWNASKTFTDLDACVTIAMPSVTADASRSYAGMLFWVIDKDNFYQAVIAPNGMFTVARKVSGKIVATAPVGWLQTPALKLGPNEKNTLRVTLEGQNVTVRINDQEIARFRGQAPDVASYVGLVASSAPAAVDTWQMTEFKVTDVAPAATAAAEQPATTGRRQHAARRRLRRRQGSVRRRVHRPRSDVGRQERRDSTSRTGRPNSIRRRARRRCAGIAASSSVISTRAPACASSRRPPIRRPAMPG